MSRIFYGVRPILGALPSALDVIRYLAEPDNLRIAHVTLRGPYVRPLSRTFLEAVNKDGARSWKVRLDGAGSFFQTRQNTVFLKVDLLDLEDLVHKPDFEGGQAHITLYDGSDRLFAHELLGELFKYDLHQLLQVSRLERLPGKAPLGGEFVYLYEDFQRSYRQYVGRDLPDRPAASIPARERIEIIKGVLNASFPTLYSKLSPRKTVWDLNYCFDF